ncbi:MAG: hypothetical protein P9X26_03995 [Candidatus Stygibacter frigidus]|nr:hypothetical protein [Candidatus Stygibacter frigidus]
MSQIDLIKIYNPANQTKQQLINNFVVRLELFQEIFKAIKTSKMVSPEQHYIIQGIRGQGKTTLLLRLAYEIQKDPELNKWLIPVIFSEEQYSNRKLYKLWELTADCLKYEPGFESLYTDMQKLNDDIDYEINCFQLLENRLKHNKKKLVLFIDNINDMFDKFKKKDCQRLREVLQQTCELRIIGASSVSIEFHYEYEQPFYEFFRTPKLKGLTLPETQTLLLKLGEYYKSERVKEIVEEQTGRIEALRRLTGGVIRNIVLLFNIFVDEEDGNAFNDLEEVLDNVTPLYKHRMDNLSPQQQEIMDFIALNWDAVSTKEIAAKVKEDSRAVSSQIKLLIKNNLIEKQKTNTKNHLYRLSERFFNIWYLMRHGGKKEENKIKWLVEFLIEWCDNNTLEHRAKKHIEAMEKGKMLDKQALYLTEALSCTHINMNLQDKLIKTTRTYLEGTNSELLSHLHPSNLELYEYSFIENSETEDDNNLDTLLRKAIYNHSKAKNFEMAEYYYLKAVKKNSTVAMYNIALIYETEYKNFSEAEKYYLMAVEKEDAGAMYNLACLYETKLNSFDKAEKYFLMAIEKGYLDAIYNLAYHYDHFLKDFKKAEFYYLMAVDKKMNRAMNNLGLLYQNEFKDSQKAEKYFLMATKKGDSKAMYNLAFFYQNKFNDFQKAEKYYLMALSNGEVKAINNLALIYQKEKMNYKEAEKYFLMAVDRGDEKAIENLAFLYWTEFKEYKKAVKYYLIATEMGLDNAMFNLATIYKIEFKDFEKAEQYYLMASEKGNSLAMNNLAYLYEAEFHDIKKAEKYYLMAIEKENIDAIVNLAMLYELKFKDNRKAEKYYLKAIDKENDKAMFLLANLYFDKLKDFRSAEKYYLMAVEKGNDEAMVNLAYLYEEHFEDYINAEKYYLLSVEKDNDEAMKCLAYFYKNKKGDLSQAVVFFNKAIKKGNVDAMLQIAILYYSELKEYGKAEKYLLMAIDHGNTLAILILALFYKDDLKDYTRAEKYLMMALENGEKKAVEGLSWMYYELNKNRILALNYAEKAYKQEAQLSTSHTYATILLWNNEIEKALEISNEFFDDKEAYEKYPEDIRQFLMLLIAKKQYHSTYKIFNNNPMQLKDRFKPLYYALMFFLQKEYPNEYIKMGSELKQTVDEIIKVINEMSVKYA